MFQKRTNYGSLIGIRAPNRLVRSLFSAPTAFLHLPYIIIWADDDLSLLSLPGQSMAVPRSVYNFTHKNPNKSRHMISNV